MKRSGLKWPTRCAVGVGWPLNLVMTKIPDLESYEEPVVADVRQFRRKHDPEPPKQYDEYFRLTDAMLRFFKKHGLTPRSRQQPEA